MNLDPKAIAVFFIKNFLSTIYILPIWFIGISIFENVWTKDIGIVSEPEMILLLDGAGLIFIALLFLGCYIWSWLTFINFTYELAQDGLNIHHGIFIRKHILIPYTDIEKVELLVNPLVVHFLNLYSLNLITRELTNTEGIFRKKRTQLIPGLSSEVARSLRAKLIQYSHVQTVRKTFFDPTSGVYK
jgi:membrane protein YdbS with pleckstrin-like domain